MSPASVRVYRDGVATPEGRPKLYRSYEDDFFSGGRETRTLAELVKGVGGSGDGESEDRIDGRSSVDVTLTATAIGEALGGHHGQVRSEAGKVPPPPFPAPPPPSASTLEVGSTAASTGCGGDVVSTGDGVVGGHGRGGGGNGSFSGGGMVGGREGGGGLPGRRVEDKALELSLDLSDCSDEVGGTKKEHLCAAKLTISSESCAGETIIPAYSGGLLSMIWYYCSPGEHETIVRFCVGFVSIAGFLTRECPPPLVCVKHSARVSR